MAFLESVVKQAWDKCGGKCESCRKELLWASRGSESMYGWEAHHKSATILGGADSLSNCKILCQSCHKKTSSYGR